MYQVKNPRRVSVARAVVAALAVGLAGAASAAIDITAEATAAKADIATAGGIIVGVMVAIAVIAWIRRVVK